MRIAFGFDIFYPETNGVITATINLASNLIRMGHEVWFFVPNDRGFRANVIENGIRIVHIKGLPSFIYKGIKLIPIYGWFLMPYLKAYRIDIVHNTSPWLMGMALNHAARRLHIPTIATHHTLINNPIYMKYALKSMTLANAAQNAIWKVVFAPFYKLTWYATAPNVQTCRQVKEKFPELRVKYISNGIDISRFDKSMPERPLPPEVKPEWIGRNTLIYVGRLGYEKAIDVAIKAFIICLGKNPDAHFLVIGSGPAEKELEKLIEDPQAMAHIHMTGKIANEAIIGSRLLSKTQAFVTASLSENQAMTVIEALCSGTPVIAPDVDNMRALVSDEQGWFFRGDDVDDLADRMDWVLTHPEERDRKAEAAVKSINLYDGSKVAKQFEDLYREVLQMKNDGFYVPGGEKRAAKYLRKSKHSRERKS